jgi:5-methylcytosine-specific restriction endonuclease McrA
MTKADLNRLLDGTAGAWQRVQRRIIGELLDEAIWRETEICDGNAVVALQNLIEELSQRRQEVRAHLPSGNPATYVKQRISYGLRRQVFERDAYRCQQCGTHLNLTVDHIIPESKGGTLHLENLQTLCQSCNSRKGVRV